MDTVDMLTTMTANVSTAGSGHMESGIHPESMYSPIGMMAVILESVLMVLIIGNGLIFAVFHNSEYVRTVSNYYILQLAIADFSVGLLMPVHIAMYIHPYILDNLHVCLFHYTSLLLCQSASISSLVALTFDRFRAVTWPLHYHETLTRKQYIRSVIIVWSIPLTLGFILPMFWHNDWDKVPVKECDMMFVLKLEYICYIMIPAFASCTLVLVCIYFKIFRVAAYHSANIARTEILPSGNNAETPQESQRLLRHMRMVKTGMIVLGGFYLCWLPFMLISGIQAYGGYIHNHTIKYVRNLALFPAIFNSALNPIIYSFRLSTFKLEFAKILRMDLSTGGSDPDLTTRQKGDTKQTLMD